MLAANPMLLWNTGFQLSFLACLGLISMVDPIQQWMLEQIEKRFSEGAALWWQPVIALVVSTLVAQFSVSPVLLTLNPVISMNTLAANLALLPIQPILMALGGLAVFLSFCLPPLGKLFSLLTWPFLAYNNRVAEYLGFHPSAELSAPGWLTAVSLAAFLAALLFFSTRQIHSLTKIKKR